MISLKKKQNIVFLNRSYSKCVEELQLTNKSTSNTATY